MTQRSLYYNDVGQLDRKVRDVSVTFFPQGGSDPTFVARDNKDVASITRSGAGTWLVTLKSRFARLLHHTATIRMAAATDVVAQLGTVSNLNSASAVTLVVRANAAATPTDIAADANNCITLALRFADSDT